jgi:putative transposase
MVREEVEAAARARIAAKGLPLPIPQEMKFSPAEYSSIWEEYERSGVTHKRRAEAAHEALLTFRRKVDAGFSVGEAEKEAASQHGTSKPTLWRYRQATKGHPPMHWLPLLSPRYKGGRPPAEFTEAAYDYIRSGVFSTSKQPWAIVLKEAREQAKANGWVIPGDAAIRARLEKEPKWLDTVGRTGPKALERSYPAIKRDYSRLALHELWESDGRKSDVFCIWPDGTVARPFIIVWREVRSRLVLGVKGFINPSMAAVLAAFGMALSRAETAPAFAKIDNGPEYAGKQVTGGQANRYRFKVVTGEPIGVMTAVGTKVEWSKPGRGQDKPVEAFWNFIVGRCDKAKEFEGAYCGKDTPSKPEPYGLKNTIPIALYGAKLAAVIEYFNTEHRHIGSGMNGRTPFEVYSELAAKTKSKPVDPTHIRLCKMGLKQIKPNATDATYTLTIPGYGLCRYWSETIAGLPRDVLSRKHAVYYDLENPRSPVSVYDGRQWLGDAPQFEELPFRNTGDGPGNHVKAKNAWLKPKVAALKQIKAAGQGGTK